MTPLEKLRQKITGKSRDIFLFCPAIYEHKAKLLQKSISEVAQDARLLAESVFAEYETYKPDMLTVGMDIYNIEAQALGGVVVYPDSPDVVPSIKDRLIESLDEVEKLPRIDPENAGRMPLVIEAAETVNKKLGDQVPVRGAVSGPYSIAAELFGIEKLIMEMVMNPQAFSRLIDYCADISLRYGLEFIKRGMGVCLFDSQASPPLISPENYKDHLLERMKHINTQYKKHGCEFTEYVIGGRTDEIANMMIETGFEIVLSDFCAEPAMILGKTGDHQLIRRNINPRLVEQGQSDDLDEQITETVKTARIDKSVIIGTGVLSYNTPIENVIYTKNKCEEFFSEV